jgi:hypothetical protein
MKYMPGITITIAILLISFDLPAQLKDSTACGCSYSFTLRYPKKAEGITGKVIIEFSEDSLCMWSDPVIIQKAGHGFDEEAMRAMNTIIQKFNACRKKCTPCIPGKRKQTFTFQSPEE